MSGLDSSELTREDIKFIITCLELVGGEWNLGDKSQIQMIIDKLNGIMEEMK